MPLPNTEGSPPKGESLSFCVPASTERVGIYAPSVLAGWLMPIIQQNLPMLTTDVRILSRQPSDTAPFGWQSPSFDDSSWPVATLVTPDPLHSVDLPLTHDEEPLWTGNGGAGTRELALVRWHFELADISMVDANGDLAVGEIFPVDQTLTIRTAFGGNGELVSPAGLRIRERMNGLSSSGGGAWTVSDVIIGGSNLYAMVVNIGSLDTGDISGPWANADTWVSTAWIALTYVLLYADTGGGGSGATRSFAHIIG